MDENKIITDTLYKKARNRVYLRKSVIWHIGAYILVNALQVVIYFLTTPGGYFWPIWSLLGWGTGLLCHGLVVKLLLRGGKQTAIEQEYQRLLQRERDEKANN